MAKQFYRIQDHPDVLIEVRTIAPQFDPFKNRITEEEIKSTGFYEIVQEVTHLDASLKQYQKGYTVVLKICAIAATSPNLKVFKLSGEDWNNMLVEAFRPFAKSSSISTIDLSNSKISLDHNEALLTIRQFAKLNLPISTFIAQSNQLYKHIPVIVTALKDIPSLRKIDLRDNNTSDDPDGHISEYEGYKAKAREIVDEHNQNPANILKVPENNSLLFGAWAVCSEYLPQDITNLILGHYSPALEIEL
jgi:hypothetical protein